MKITICGLAGTGTSTITKMLAGHLDYPDTSSGNMFRRLAESMNISLHELEILSQADSRYDKELDVSIADYGKKHPDCVIDSRLAWHFVPDSIKIKLTCDYHIRIGRVADRENISFTQAETETTKREKLIADRYLRYYGIEDFLADDHFDLIIDTSNTQPEEVLSMILDYLAKE